MNGQLRSGTRGLRAVQTAIGVLLVIVLASVAKRLIIDVPNIVAGTLPPDDYDVRFVTEHWPAYLHIGPGVVYLLLALPQLAYRFRRRHYEVHKRLGRFAAGSAILSGVFALVFGIFYPYGGLGESSATVVFGVWFLVCLVLALRAIRADDIVNHRRWMIRAFAVAVGIGTIRIWLGIFQATGLLDFQSSFGPAFWVAFSLHVVIGELWLRAYPDPPEVVAERRLVDLPAGTPDGQAGR